MNYNSGRLLLFPKVNQAKINEQKVQKACRLKIQIECDMKRNKTTSLYNLYDQNKSEQSFDSKIKTPVALSKNHRHHPSLFNNFHMQRAQHQKIWQLINKNLLSRHYQEDKKSLHKTDIASNQEQEQNNQHNLFYPRSIQILRGKHKFKRLKTQPKAQSNLNPEKQQRKKFKQFFNIKSIKKDDEQLQTLSPKLQNIKQMRSKLKKQNLKNQLLKANNERQRRKVQSKLMSLNGWKTEQDQLILFN